MTDGPDESSTLVAALMPAPTLTAVLCLAALGSAAADRHLDKRLLRPCARGNTSEPLTHHLLVQPNGIFECQEPRGDCSVQCANDEEVRAVRCCSNRELPRWENKEWCPGLWQTADAWGECQELPFPEAEALCEEQGGRLCTSLEVQQLCVVDSGCGFDNRLIWTKDKCGEALPSGGEVFVLSSFSHDDQSQLRFIPVWHRHYTYTLGLKSENILLILHSDSSDSVGLEWLGRIFRGDYGVLHTYPNVQPYTSQTHWQIKMEILKAHVSPRDWVIQVDADELVFFPLNRSPLATFRNLDSAKVNAHYGLMIDRIAEDGNLDRKPRRGVSPFRSYPLTCALTLLWQSSDIRKATAYRGYLRTTSGNHGFLGLCHPNSSRSYDERTFARGVWATAKKHSKHREAKEARIKRYNELQLRTLMEKMEFRYASVPYEMLPFAELGEVCIVEQVPDFATVYHFKWVHGIEEKLKRRAETEKYTMSQYEKTRKDLANGHLLTPEAKSKFCTKGDFQGVEEVSPRALGARELMMLFFNIKDSHLQMMIDADGCEKRNEERYLTHLVARLVSNAMLHETMC